MSKYLIQDIIPPEKKHRRAGTKKSAVEEHSIVHPEYPIRPQKQAGEDMTRSAFLGNPRRMIVEQIESGETEYAKHEEAPEETSEPLDIKTEKNVLGETTTEWPYGLHNEEKSVIPDNVPPRFPEYPTKRNWAGFSQWLPWLIGIGLVVVVGVILLNFFSGATITVVPKHSIVSIPEDQKFVALKDGAAGDLAYAIMKETASSSLEVPATGEKTVIAKASGKIIVYNEQLSAQRLIKNTRFESPSGKIYRISESINVPKAVMKGTTLTPGSLEVTVYADEAGPSYNSPPVDFTVPGLKTSSIYKKVYARSNGSLSGGASGTVKTVSDQDLKQAGEDLRVQLETKLRSKVRGSLASFQIIFDQGIIVELGEPSLSKSPASSDNKAIVSEEGAIYVVTFKRDDLVHSIASALVPTYKGEQIHIKNLEALVFEMDPTKGSDLLSGKKLDFTLKGAPELTWVVDETALRTSLLGVSEEKFKGILDQYSSIERAEANIRPRWKDVFPDDPAKISIVINEARGGQ